MYPNSRISPISPNLYKVEINGTHTEWGWYIENEPYYYPIPKEAGDEIAVIYNPNNGYWDGSGYIKEGVPRWGPHPVTDWYEVSVIWYSDEKLTSHYLHP